MRKQKLFQYNLKALPILILLILVFFRYGYVLQSCFQYDDYVYLFDLHWMNLTDYLFAGLGGHFYPLFKLEVLALHTLFGYDSRSFFGILLLVHSVNTLLFYRILQRMEVHPFLVFAFSALWATSAVFYRGFEWYSAFGALSFSTLCFLLTVLLGIRALDSDRISLISYSLGLALALAPIFFISGYTYAILAFPFAWSLKLEPKKILWALFSLLPIAVIALFHFQTHRVAEYIDKGVIQKYFPHALLYLTSNGWAGLLGFPEHSIVGGLLVMAGFFIGVCITRPNKLILSRIAVLFLAILCFYSSIHVGRTATYLGIHNANLESGLKALSEFSRYHYFPSLLVAMSLALLTEQVRLTLNKKLSGQRALHPLMIGCMVLFLILTFLGNTVNLKASRVVADCAMSTIQDQNFISRIRSNGVTKPMYFYNANEPINAFVGKDVYPGLAGKFWIMRSHIGTDYQVQFVEPDQNLVDYWRKVFPEFGKVLVIDVPENTEVIKEW
jgi:hypothetical protein